MPLPNGEPTIHELEVRARKSRDSAERLAGQSDPDAMAIAMASLAAADALMVVAVRLEAINDMLPLAGRGD